MKDLRTLVAHAGFALDIAPESTATRLRMHVATEDGGSRILRLVLARDGYVEWTLDPDHSPATQCEGSFASSSLVPWLRLHVPAIRKGIK